MTAAPSASPSPTPSPSPTSSVAAAQNMVDGVSVYSNDARVVGDISAVPVASTSAAKIAYVNGGSVNWGKLGVNYGGVLNGTYTFHYIANGPGQPQTVPSGTGSHQNFNANSGMTPIGQFTNQNALTGADTGGDNSEEMIACGYASSFTSDPNGCLIFEGYDFSYTGTNGTYAASGMWSAYSNCASDPSTTMISETCNSKLSLSGAQVAMNVYPEQMQPSPPAGWSPALHALKFEEPGTAGDGSMSEDGEKLRLRICGATQGGVVTSGNCVNYVSQSSNPQAYILEYEMAHFGVFNADNGCCFAIGHPFAPQTGDPALNTSDINTLESLSIVDFDVLSSTSGVIQAPVAFAPRAEQCVTIYTAAQGNPACNPLYDSSDTAVNGGPVPDPSSSPWIAIEAPASAAPAITDITAPTATQTGGANYGQDAAQSMAYNPNGAASISTAGLNSWTNLTCNNANFSCGHSYSTESLFLPPTFRGENPDTDHHLSAQGQPCDSNGVSKPVNAPYYHIAAGDRCEMDTWLWAPAYPNVIPAAYTSGGTNTATVQGIGQCDEDAPLGWYACSGSTSSDIPEGMNLNPADLVAAVQSGTYVPYAIMTAVIQTTGHWVFPSVYFDGYETSTTAGPPNGARFWSDITDAQVNATSWSPALKALMRTYHHMGGIIFDTTGGYGSGFSPQMIGGSGFTAGLSSDAAATDPVLWLASAANGGAGTTSIGNGNGGSETGLDIPFSIAPYSVSADFHFCMRPTYDTDYSTVASVPKTCGNI